jgi:hypothetical protein
MTCSVGSFIAILILIMIGLQVAFAQSIVMPPNVTNNIILNTSTLLQPIKYDGSISGYVLDMKGNGVAQAFVTLYNNSTIMQVNPVFSSNGTCSPMGVYQFSGLAPGNYSIIAEIADGLQSYNGTAVYDLAINESATLNVTVNGFVVSPWLRPTPAPTVEAQPTVVPTQQPTVIPTPTPGGISGIMGYVFAAVPLTVIGVGAFIWIGKRPNKKKAPARTTYTMGASSRRAWAVNAAPASINRNLPTLSTSQLFRNNPDYRHDLEDLNYDTVMNDLTEIAIINRVNKLAKKYSIDQVTIFHDMGITRYRRY